MVKVEVGQVWADNDKRAAGRRIKVLRLYTVRRRIRVGSRRVLTAEYGDVAYAYCEVVAERPGRIGASTLGRKVHIQVGRMQPTATGYWLVK